MGVYCGVVGTHRDSNAHSDSLFELGWFREGPNWAPLVVDGYSSNDGTRFVNSKPNEKNNMWAIIGVYREELTILYLTHHQVEED